LPGVDVLSDNATEMPPGDPVYYRVNVRLPFQRLDDQLMIFNPESDEVHVLNVTMAAIWEGVRDGLQIDGIERRLRERYDLDDIPDAGGMILAAILELVTRGCLEPATPDR